MRKMYIVPLLVGAAFILAGCAPKAAAAGSSSDTTLQAPVTSVEVLPQGNNSSQVRVLVHGILPGVCYTLQDEATAYQERIFAVILTAARIPGSSCSQSTAPYDKVIPLQVTNLSPGKYTVMVNGMQAAFALGESLAAGDQTVALAKPGPTPEPANSPLPTQVVLAQAGAPTEPATAPSQEGQPSAPSAAPVQAASPAAPQAQPPAQAPVLAAQPTTAPAQVAVPAAANPPAQQMTCLSQPDNSFAAQVVDLINQQRANFGVPALKINNQLNAAAAVHSMDMSCNNFVEHYGSDGSTFFTRITVQGYRYSYASENLASGNPAFGGSPEWVVNTLWMNSQVHRDNILNPNVTEIGVSYVYNIDSQWGGYTTVDFARGK